MFSTGLGGLGHLEMELKGHFKVSQGEYQPCWALRSAAGMRLSLDFRCRVQQPPAFSGMHKDALSKPVSGFQPAEISAHFAVLSSVTFTRTVEAGVPAQLWWETYVKEAMKLSWLLFILQAERRAESRQT